MSNICIFFFQRRRALLREGLSETVRCKVCLLQSLHKRQGIASRRESSLSSDVRAMHEVRRSVWRRRGDVSAGCRDMASALRTRTDRSERYRKWSRSHRRAAYSTASRIRAHIEQRFGDAGEASFNPHIDSHLTSCTLIRTLIR